ncbi:hypothetical protein GN956_G3815 [Arapaima gigas]
MHIAADVYSIYKPYYLKNNDRRLLSPLEHRSCAVAADVTKLFPAGAARDQGECDRIGEESARGRGGRPDDRQRSDRRCSFTGPLVWLSSLKTQVEDRTFWKHFVFAKSTHGLANTKKQLIQSSCMLEQGVLLFLR